LVWQHTGFNTDYRPLVGDLEDVDNSPYTHSVSVSNLEQTMVDGVIMVPFLLDINQEGSSPLLSLDELMVYTAPVPDLSDLAGLLASNLIYDIGVGNKIYLDFSLNNGSGSGDMIFFLPKSLFDGLGTQFMYLYSKFGATGGDYASNDGYEEWAQIIGLPVATEDRAWGEVKCLFR